MSYLTGVLLRGTLEEETIKTLADRLQHATLAADRRSAVLGLKSFSRQFREAVIENGTRGLIACLHRDTADLGVVRAVLETFLVLLLPEREKAQRVQSGKYPLPLAGGVATDQFLVWIADELLLSAENVALLVDVLGDHGGFHERMYALQLLEAVVALRQLRARASVAAVPTAVATLVLLLADRSEAVRDEAVLLLTALARGNFGIQKLIAFQNCFEALFGIVREEGGLRGSVVVHDCLVLVHSLLAFNALNQVFFREAGCIARLGALLDELVDSFHWTPQRVRNADIALGICKSLVDEGNPHTTANQNALAPVFLTVMRVAFSPETHGAVRDTALRVLGDVMAGNDEMQLRFCNVDVPYTDPSAPLARASGPCAAPLVLLRWALEIDSVHFFRLRLAAAYCLGCAFKNNSEYKLAFIADQAALADQGDLGDTAPNLFRILMAYDPDTRLNPYRSWFAAVTLIALFEDCPEARARASAVSTGNESAGEERLLAVQAVAGILTTTLDGDPRIAAGYLMLLTIWLHEDLDAVDEFSRDVSVVKSIIAYLHKDPSDASEMLQGMCATLLGTATEFCRVEGPVGRPQLHSMVVHGVGVANYAVKVGALRACASFRLFDVSLDPDFEWGPDSLPAVYFVAQYVDLVKLTYSRVKAALLHDPALPPKVAVDFERLEALEKANAALHGELDAARGQIDALLLKVAQRDEQIADAQHRLGSVVETEARLVQAEDLAKVLALERDELQRECDALRTEKANMARSAAETEKATRKREALLSQAEAARTKAEAGINKMSRELFALTLAEASHTKQLDDYRKQLDDYKRQVEDYKRQVDDYKRQVAARNTQVAALEQQIGALEKKQDTEKHQDTEKRHHTENAQLLDKLKVAALVVQSLREETKAAARRSDEATRREVVLLTKLHIAYAYILGKTESPETADCGLDTGIEVPQDIREHKQRILSGGLELISLLERQQKDASGVRKALSYYLLFIDAAVAPADLTAYFSKDSFPFANVAIETLGDTLFNDLERDIVARYPFSERENETQALRRELEEVMLLWEEEARRAQKYEAMLH